MKHVFAADKILTRDGYREFDGRARVGVEAETIQEASALAREKFQAYEQKNPGTRFINIGDTTHNLTDAEIAEYFPGCAE